jgi:hypothetical protein
MEEAKEDAQFQSRKSKAGQYPLSGESKARGLFRAEKRFLSWTPYPAPDKLSGRQQAGGLNMQLQTKGVDQVENGRKVRFGIRGYATGQACRIKADIVRHS